MDDIKIAERFIQNLDSDHAGQTLTLFGVGEANILAIRFKEIDPQLVVLAPESASVPNWSTLAAHGQEQWPIAFLMPSGAILKTKSK
jgi:hypothetical protein